MLKKYLTVVIALSLAQGTLAEQIIPAAALEIDKRIEMSLKLQRAEADAHNDYAEHMEHVYKNIRPECKEFAIQYLSMTSEWNVNGLTGQRLMGSKLSAEDNEVLKKHLLNQVNAFCAAKLK